MGTHIVDRNVLEQYSEDMVKYAMFVNRKRMIPDYKDGLKTVQRRLLYTMYTLRTFSEGSKVKSARIVGEMVGKYHPHGDSAAYMTMKPMVNWYESMLPTIKGEGNWGNIQGDSCAAMRYTEAYLNKFALDYMLRDLSISKKTIDWMPTFDNSDLEPEYLSIRVPFLLINGAFGIGFGIKVDIPPHNPNEVIDATLALLDDPSTPVILVPDQCQKCEIVETNFKGISNRGSGHFLVRGIIDIEDERTLVIKSLPDLIFLDTVIANIDKLVKDKKLPQIADYEDQTEDDKKTGITKMRFVIKLKKGSDPNYVRDVLYKSAGVADTKRVNFQVLDGVEIKRMSYRSYLLNFIQVRELALYRLYANTYQQAETKLHEKDAFIKALESGEIDKIIKIIQKNKTINDDEDIEYLIKKLNITDLQAKYILNASIKSLSIGYLNKYKEEAQKLYQIREDAYARMLNEDLLKEEIRQDLIQFKQEYGRPRNCRIISEGELNNIPQGEFKIVITENNFIKKVQVNEQVGNYKGDIPKLILKGDNSKDMLIFDELGKVFKLPICKIPFVDKGSNGIDLRLLVKKLTSNINAIIYEPMIDEFSRRIDTIFYMVVVTTQGNIKKLDLKDFLAVPPSGILFMKLDEGDTIKSISIVGDKADVLVYSRNKVLRMPISDIPHQRRNTKGVKAMNAQYIDGMSIINSTSNDIIVITNNGYINKINSLAIPRATRNRAGNSVIKLGKTDYIRAILTVNEGDIVRITAKSGVIDIPVETINVGSSISAGKKMISDVIIKCNVIKNA